MVEEGIREERMKPKKGKEMTHFSED